MEASKLAKQLIVVVGAGASFDCSRAMRNDDLRPPLVTQLFEGRRSFATILHEYTLAEQAAADIRPAISSGAVAIEEFLRTRLRDAEDEYARRRYFQIPLYLQHLMETVGRTNGTGYTIHPDNYDALLNAALALDDVLFLSLNYDTLLDDRLFAYDGLQNLDSYIGDRRNWSLIKLHGSVNWGRPLREMLETGYSNAPLELVNSFFANRQDTDFDPAISLRTGSLSQMRMDGHTHTLYYPGLAVPLGSDDELVLPHEHLSYARERLSSMERAGLLILGYSGLDREVLELLGIARSQLHSLIVVNGSGETGEAALARINERLGFPYLTGQNVFPGGFGEYIAGGHLTKFVDAL